MEPTASTSGPPSDGQLPSPRQVLIADDDAASRKIAAALLAASDYRIRFATSGEEALAAVGEARPDLVLLDVMMPGLDGFEVCRRLRERLSGEYVPIILVTSLDGRSDVVQGLKAGADDFLHKPVHGAELRARVSNLLKVRAYHQLLASQRDSALATVELLRQQVLHADRLATLGTLAASVSHELNNISQVLRSALDPGASDEDGWALAQNTTSKTVLTHVANHVTELSRTLLHIARPSGGPTPEIELGQILEEVHHMLRLTGRIRHAAVSLVLPQERCVLRANAVQAQQVFLNLIGNAADAVVSTPGARIEAGIRPQPGGRLEAWVRDNGPGMSEEVRARIFEPFFTTKPPGVGTGLGLAVVKQLVESWGGQIRVQSQPGQGTCMVLDLPAAPAP
ncbi:sensor histidine kinase [Stigmatella erecta]|uniref:histidine kinase n=1 Tax=Stigmatella erecta TaxID=83460 RepID=A0A1I0CES3_9BACT|nr:response regulator [Stigmatella erecta]SET17810.1 Histidine kinase-, DNA gyrase B-, and HSP90-like ATPase [Stigmatella erecta]